MKIIINTCINTQPENSLAILNSGDFYLNILAALDYDINSAPVADLLSRLHGLDGDWLVISPIYWQATHNDAMILAAAQDFNLSENQGQEWFLELTKFIDNDAIKVHYHNAHTWLIQIKDNLTIKSKPVHSLLNKSIMPELENLDTTLFWARFITESQMYLNNHKLNKNRKYPINGFWVWGGGNLKAVCKNKLIACDAESFKIANLLSREVSLLSKAKLHNNSILISSNGNLLQDIDTKLAKKTVNWYWNNIAYKIQPKNWYQKLFWPRS